MDKAYVEKHHVVDRYVQGQLDEEDLADFEILMLESQELTDEVELAIGMQAALKRNSHDLRPPAQSPGFLNRTPRRAAGLAVAASVLCAFSLLFTAYSAQKIAHLESMLALRDEPIAIDREIRLELLRSSAPVKINTAEGQSTLLRVDVSFAPSASYEVELLRGNSEVIWTKSGMRADTEQIVGVLVPDAADGIYRIVVTTEFGEPISAEYRIEIVRSTH